MHDINIHANIQHVQARVQTHTYPYFYLDLDGVNYLYVCLFVFVKE